MLCRDLKLCNQAVVAIDGSKLKAETPRLRDKIARLRQQMRELDTVKKADQDSVLRSNIRDRSRAESMATSGKGAGMVAYNLQMAVMPNTI
jgi:hypothetical protein